MTTYRIKKFSELTSVTVRSLQYYDEIGLLKPSARTQSGHRLYSDNDMLTLQQITTLKFMGFTLNQISDVLEQSELNLEEILKLQSEMLETKAQQLAKAVRLTNQAKTMLQQYKHIDWTIIATIIEVLDMNELDIKTWTKKLFTPEEVEQFKKINEENQQKSGDSYEQEWRDLFADVKQNLKTDPAGPVGQALAKRWMAQVEKVYGKDQNIELRRKLWSAFKAGSAPKEMSYFDQDVVDYIDKAWQYFHNK